ncbi:MAG: DUF3526 domain-containing protein [Woeseiaceae bacterium]|nr:DUF3526 domain-containing protein [Woeseiaceae bacterium]
MTGAFRIAVEEWRYWSRSRLAISATVLLLIVILAAVISTVSRMQSESDARRSMQIAAEETFLAQPDRHPHRMVHYGHYVFRTPAPLAVIDPGVDPLTGTVMFLEGHRHNSATFPAAYTAPQVAGFSFLTPAFTYQVLVPLVLIVVGFSVFARERELQTDTQLAAQGVGPMVLWLGKTLALLGLSAVVVLPLAIVALLATSRGESLGTASTLVLAYFLYLAVWSFAIVGFSARAQTAAMSLLWCCVAWLFVTVLVPKLASDAGNTLSPVAGKLQTDMALIEEMRSVGDGHNTADPAFEALRARVLDQYGVESVEELPVNFRGIVAETAEANLTEVLNRFAEERMHNELEQARIARNGAFLSPMVAIRNASMQTVGSDLGHHHRFLREAEAARYEFVQGLNRAHINQLSYIDDINRNNNDAAGMRARVSSENWRVLQSFDFQPAPASDRIRAAGFAIVLLFLWSVAAAWFAYLGIRNTEGRFHAG